MAPCKSLSGNTSLSAFLKPFSFQHIYPLRQLKEAGRRYVGLLGLNSTQKDRGMIKKEKVRSETLDMGTPDTRVGKKAPLR